MPPIEAEIGSAADDSARWLPFLEGLAEDSSFHSLRELFLDQAKQAAAEPSHDLEALYAVLSAICSYYFRREEPLTPFGPQFVAGGSRSAIPSDLREGDLDALGTMLPQIVPMNVRARAADVLWLRRRNRDAAGIAVESYIESSRQSANSTRDSLEHIERALQIALQLGKGGDTLVDRVIARIHEMLADSDPWAIAPRNRLLHMLTRHGVQEGLEPHLDDSVANAVKLRDDGKHAAARRWFELASELARALENAKDARAHAISAAETFVAEAESEAAKDAPVYLRAVAIMEHAIKAYRSIGGMRQRVDELHARMLNWQEHIPEQLQRTSTPIDLTDVAHESMDHVAGRSLPQALVALAHIFDHMDPDQIRPEVVRLMSDIPMQFLVSRSFIDSKGRVVARPPAMVISDENAAEAAVQAEMFNQARVTMGIAVRGAINPARRVLVTEHSLNRTDLLELIGQSPFIPPGHEPMYVRGLWAGFNGDFATAAAILAPELENAIRSEADRHSLMLPRLSDDATHEVRQLGELLYHPEAENVFGRAKLFTLKAALCNDFGADLRDKVAHGLMNYAEFASAESAFMWWLALRLAIEPMIQVVGANEEDSEPGEASNGPVRPDGSDS